MDISTLLEAGLQINGAIAPLADIADSFMGDNVNSAMSSDCCSSNNYPPPSEPTLPN